MKKRGVTLVELMVSLGIFSIIMVVALSLLISVMGIKALSSNMRETQQKTRVVFDMITRLAKEGKDVTLSNCVSTNTNCSTLEIFMPNSETGAIEMVKAFRLDVASGKAMYQECTSITGNDCSDGTFPTFVGATNLLGDRISLSNVAANNRFDLDTSNPTPELNITLEIKTGEAKSTINDTLKLTTGVVLENFGKEIVQLPESDLSVVSNPAGVASVSGSGTYDVGEVATASYNPATILTGYTFVNWTGDCSGTGQTTTVLMDGNPKICRANFTPSAIGASPGTGLGATFTSSVPTNCDGTRDSSYIAGSFPAVIRSWGERQGCTYPSASWSGFAELFSNNGTGAALSMPNGVNDRGYIVVDYGVGQNLSNISVNFWTNNSDGFRPIVAVSASADGINWTNVIYNEYPSDGAPTTPTTLTGSLGGIRPRYIQLYYLASGQLTSGQFTYFDYLRLY